MAIIDFAQREITVKVVYFGAPGAGSNTNVRRLHQMLALEDKGKLLHFGSAISEDDSFFFDYGFSERSLFTGFAVRFRVYSMPGAIANPVHRREVLTGTDGVVFIADARAKKHQANLDSMLILEKLLAEQDLDLMSIPVVLQVNHGDAADAQQPKEVVRELNPFAFPVCSAIAKKGKGVVETHEQMTSMILDRIRDHLAGNQTAIALTTVQGPDRDEEVIAKHLAALEEAERNPAGLEASASDQDYQGLPEGPCIELPFQPKTLIGTRPVHLLEARLDGPDVRLDLVLSRVSGGDPRRLGIRLVNRPADVRPLPATPMPSTSSDNDDITSSLPDKVELASVPRDFPPVWYGVAGIGGGVIIGVLLGYLVFG